jgi:glycosyltransferase involved in cell wall biosynthesis
VPGKRVDRALVAARRAGASLVVVGDGPERERLARLAEDLRVRARFVGRVPRDEALAWIAAADRLVHLSDAEGAPTVVREARALGVPVLASAAGDVPAWAASDPGIEIAREAVDRRAALDVGSPGHRGRPGDAEEAPRGAGRAVATRHVI